MSRRESKSNRCVVLLTLTASLAASALIVTPVLADETFGVITQVDLKNKKVTLFTEAAEELSIDVTESTAVVTGKMAKLELGTVADSVSKAQQAGMKGVFASVTHEKTLASRIRVGVPKEKPKPKPKPEPKPKAP